MKVRLFQTSRFGNLPHISTEILPGPGQDIFNLMIYRLKLLKEVIEATVNNVTTGCKQKRKK